MMTVSTTIKNNVAQWQRSRAFAFSKRDWSYYRYPWELSTSSPADALHQSYSTLINKIFDTSQYIFVTVNLSTSQIRQALESKRKKSGGILPPNYLRLGQEYLLARRAGVKAVDAMQTLWDKFLKRLNAEVLGAHRAKRREDFLRWIRVYENSGKRYKTSPPTHLHMLLELPDRYSYPEFGVIFRQLFSLLIYPIPCMDKNNKVLDIRVGRSDGENSHPVYVQKQLVDWETASDRVFPSGIPKRIRPGIAMAPAATLFN
jgi:hypothetical protein